ncbi:MAG TPA: Glu/Leu/Phe/Val dehydrogenase, partial [Bacteroidota bacterium]
IDVVEQLTGKNITEKQKLALVRGPEEEDLVNSGLEDTMIVAYHEIRSIWKNHAGIDLRTAAFISSIDKIGTSYLELGIFP